MADENIFQTFLRIRKDGLFTIQNAARTICIAARWAAPIIQSKYALNLPLQAALQAAMAACEVLDLEIERQRQYNNNNPPDINDTFGGGQPTDPPPPDPDPDPGE